MKINIKKILKKEAASLRAILPEDLKMHFYYKDRKLNKFNKTITLTIDTMLATLSYKKPVRAKDFDLYNDVDVLAQSYSYADKNRIVIGEKFLLGGKFEDDVSRNFWDNFLAHLPTPADRFKYLFYHEAAHLVQQRLGLRFNLSAASIEENVGLSEHIKQLQDPLIASLASEMYADCFALYMSTRERPEMLDKLAALIIDSRQKSPATTTINRQDAAAAILDFVSHLPSEHTLTSIDEAITNATTYGVIKAIHYHSLTNKIFDVELEHFLSAEDRAYNIQKVEGFSADLQSVAYVQEHPYTELSLTTEVDVARRSNPVDMVMSTINALYYVPRDGMKV